MWPAPENRLRQQYWMDRSTSGGTWEDHFITLYRVSDHKLFDYPFNRK